MCHSSWDLSTCAKRTICCAVQAGKFEEVKLALALAGAAPHALEQAEIIIQQFRFRGRLAAMAAVGAPLLFLSHKLSRARH